MPCKRISTLPRRQNLKYCIGWLELKAGNQITSEYFCNCRLLVDKGACLEVLMGGALKMTALHLAAQDGNIESLQSLIRGGAAINAKNGRGQSALHLASLAQSPETVEVLLKAGVCITLHFNLNHTRKK